MERRGSKGGGGGGGVWIFRQTENDGGKEEFVFGGRERKEFQSEALEG